MDYHDMLAKLGIGSAHPGGMKSTFEWLDYVDISKESKVLDIGCGTGRTACYIHNTYGCKVIGIDVRPKMIQKAKLRAKAEKADMNFIVASAEQLPFQDEIFDLCITESVNVFVQAQRALKEYFRVLKPFGTYVDVEMATFGPVTQEWNESVELVYSAKFVPSLRGWKKLYEGAGFTAIETVLTKPVHPETGFDDSSKYPDTVQLADPGAYQDRNIIQIMSQNSSWLQLNHHSLVYGIFKCSKPAR